MSLRLCSECSAPVEGRPLCEACARREFAAMRRNVRLVCEPPTVRCVREMWRKLGKCQFCGNFEPCGYADGDCADSALRS